MSTKTHLALVLILTLALVSAGSGCRPRAEELWFRPGPDEVPAEVQTWVENSLPLDAGQAMAAGGVTYALVTRGSQPEGARVEIVDVTRTPEGPADVKVTVRYVDPPQGSGRTGAQCRPRDLVAINLPNARVEWAVEGDPDARVFQVLGPVEPIVAESRWIKLFSPAPDSVVSSPVMLSGLANVFEGTVNYRLVLADGTVVDAGYATGAMGDWGPFSAAVTFPAEVAGPAGARLEVFWISPKDGAEMDLIVVPLRLGASG